MASSVLRYGAIEAGGTKMVCAVGDGPDSIGRRVQIPTEDPDTTIRNMVDFFRSEAPGGLKAVGLASFGPIALRTVGNVEAGTILTTPKLPWRNFAFGPTLRRLLEAPVFVDTDVNAAVLAEVKHGAARGCHSAVYVTVGTGIGAGVMVDDHLIHGAAHPEFGHILLPTQTFADGKPDTFAGVCPSHGNCFEGIASGAAFTTRLGARPSESDPHLPEWELEAKYLACATQAMVLCYAPQRIVMGGGLMKHTHLFPLIRKHTQRLLNNYVSYLTDERSFEDLIVPPGLGADSGIVGAILLAQQSETLR